MTERKVSRCSNCLLKHTGEHPYVCPTCRASLRDAGPNMTGIFSPRQWWKGGGSRG